jgi:GxxExxY protein
MLFYRGAEVGEHRLDILVEKKLLVELKAVKALEDIFFVIGRSQMKAAGITDGIMLNFHSMPLTIRRIAPEQSSGSFQSS